MDMSANFLHQNGIAVALNLIAQIIILMAIQLLLIRISVSYTMQPMKENFVEQMQVVPLNVSLYNVLNTHMMINVHHTIQAAYIMAQVVLKNKMLAPIMRYQILSKANRVALLLHLQHRASVAGMLELIVH